ncbi:MAG: NACHT domain-containing protein [Phycisphaerales bacterium]|nr:MAG: NACHT domain-containing protein [Phycisphaerales bacterium]
MDWIGESWRRFIAWADQLGSREAAILGALSLAVLAPLIKYVATPLIRGVLSKLRKLLYPVFSGAVFFDRVWALPRYLKSVKATVGRLRNPWLAEGQELKEIFVPVSTTSDTFAKDRTDLSEVFRRVSRVVIVGEPGSGKSTGLRAIAMDCIHRKHLPRRREQYIPVFISLRRFSRSKCTLDEFILKTFEDNDFPRPARLVKKLRRAGRLVFLLDGLDEVDLGEPRTRILEDIRGMLRAENRQAGCRVYITSRPSGYDGELRDQVEEEMRMADFTPAQIRKYVNNWDFLPPKSHDHLLREIMTRRPILEICRNPLMLTIVTSLYRETQYELPDSREEFYKICIEALLRKWDAAKNQDDRNRFPAALKEAFLRQLAFKVLQVGFREISEAWLLERVEAFLATRKKAEVEAGSNAFMQEVISSGLLTKLPTGEVLFAHKTFAESLAAAFLRNKPEDLAGLWVENPEIWLEVCSLYVADPRTQIDDIGVLLGAARERENWAGFCTLAGEAHTCPDAQRAWILGELLERRGLWKSLNRRSLAALARLPADVEELLTRMVQEGTPTVRRTAIQALGYVRASWAVALVVDALTGTNTRTAAVEVLGGLGEEALPIIGHLIEEQPDNEALVRACVEAAAQVGTPAALERIVPLIWSENETIAGVATNAVGAQLRNNDIRSTFDAGSLTLPEQTPNARVTELAPWAVPWVEENLPIVKAHYCCMIDVVGRSLDPDRYPSVDIWLGSWETVFDEFPVDILIAVVLDTESPHSSAYRGRMQMRLPFEESVQDSPKLGTVIRTTEKRSKEKNKVLWSKAFGPVKDNLEISDELSVLGVFASALLIVNIPLLAAVATGTLSAWWLSLLVGFPVMGAYFAWDEGDIGVFFFFPLILFAVVPRALLEYEDWDDVDTWVGAGVLTGPALLGAAIGISQLGTHWALCLLPLLILFLVDTDEFSIVFWRRDNPLQSLRLELLGRQEG